MGIADELLALAGHLETSPSPDFEQASYRRSVSTAYYALFHLLVNDAAGLWSGSTEARLGLERAFKHDRMLWTGSWKSWIVPQLAVPIELQDFSEAFFRLQEAFHLADYENAKICTFTEVDLRLDQSRTAFHNWRKIQTHAAATDYLLGLLSGKKRE